MSHHPSPSGYDSSAPNRGNPDQPLPRRFFLSRWRGEAPIEIVFWRDMMLAGTVLNIAASMAAIVLVALDAPTAIALICYFAPLPWNLFLLQSVWRGAEQAGPRALLVRLAALTWFLVMLIF